MKKKQKTPSCKLLWSASSLLATIFCFFYLCNNLTYAAAPPPKTVPPTAVAGAQKKAEVTNNTEHHYPNIHEHWHELLKRMQTDKLYAKDVELWFAALNENYSQKPMGSKISVLFRRRFMPKPFNFLIKPNKVATVYTGVVSPRNIELCHKFIKDNATLFNVVEKKYQVPKEVLAALLMVETKLGEFMGNSLAFWSLACMAAATKPSNIDTHLTNFLLSKEREIWLEETLIARSDWAYAELKALILHCRKNKLNPLEIRGSIYGAVGICQFMPSNIAVYGVDGDGDGKIDLFTLPDALHSAANYLKKHGWKSNISKERSVNVLKRYNNSTAYANTILALAKGIAELEKKQTEAKKKSKSVKKTVPKTQKPKKPKAKSVKPVSKKQSLPRQPEPSLPNRPVRLM